MTTWLIDKSALVRLAASPDAADWAVRIGRGLVRITTVTRLEAGYSARSGPELRAGLRQPPLSSMPVEYLTPATEDRAVRNGDATVRQIAQETGYDSEFAFARAFKRATGSAPGQYRKLARTTG